MKNSFFLVIPAQQNHPGLLASYEKDSIEKWVSDLPTANPSLSTRIFYDFLEELNKVEMPAQQRLDVLEVLRPQFLIIEEYLRSRLILLGFPKGENEQKILDLLVSIERLYTIGYWMIARELTHRDVSWLQGKNVAMAIQRTVKGLNQIVVTHYMMFLPVPDWVWIDLHSLYKLSLAKKKEGIKVADSKRNSSKGSTVEDCYKQVLLLSLADPSGMMQKEILQVFNFIADLSQHVRIAKQADYKNEVQCIILMDEDAKPYFDFNGDQADTDTSMMYINLQKLFKLLKQIDKFCSTEDARFSSMHVLKKVSEKLPFGLFEYVVQRWKGVELKGATLFADRLDRKIAVGLNAIYSLKNLKDVSTDSKIEIMAESFSERALSCKFEKEGVLSIGSLVSYRKTNDSEINRILGIVKKITMPKQDGYIKFELTPIAAQCYAVTYLNLNSGLKSDRYEAILFGIKEKTFIVTDSFLLKDDDILKLFFNDDKLPIILGNRKNIGIGYWQFECRQLEEHQVTQLAKQKGYDFF